MISDETRNKWKNKVRVIEDADKSGSTRLSQWDKWTMDDIKSQMKAGDDLTFKQSKELNRIFGRVG